jgi:chemotaxis protein MotB
MAKRKKKKGDAHHGGAWKVAYADFVTAMMALFMVLWISAQDEKILLATSRYFQSPFNSPMDATTGILPFDTNQPTQSKSSEDSTDGAGPNESTTDARKIDLQFLNSVAKDFYRLLHLDENFANRPIDIQVTSDGLRITLFDRESQPLFVDNTDEFTEWGSFVIQGLAWVIDRHRFNVVIEGHTKEGVRFDMADYTSWELSSDRANAARRALVHYAVDSALIERVSGFAATRALPGVDPSDESNQRVAFSLSVGTRVPRPEVPITFTE